MQMSRKADGRPSLRARTCTCVASVCVDRARSRGPCREPPQGRRDDGGEGGAHDRGHGGPGGAAGPAARALPATCGSRAEEDTPSTIAFRERGSGARRDRPDRRDAALLSRGRGALRGDDRAWRASACYTAALVALPREELYLDAVRGRGARVAQRGSPPRRVRAEATGKRVYVSHNVPEAARESLRSRGFEVTRPAAARSPSRRSCPERCAGLRIAEERRVGSLDPRPHRPADRAPRRARSCAERHGAAVPARHRRSARAPLAGGVRRAGASCAAPCEAALGREPPTALTFTSACSRVLRRPRAAST